MNPKKKLYKATFADGSYALRTSPRNYTHAWRVRMVGEKQEPGTKTGAMWAGSEELAVRASSSWCKRINGEVIEIVKVEIVG